MATMDSLLDADPDNVYEQLLLQAGEGLPEAPQPTFQAVRPKSGFCLKTKNDKNEKVFINVCKSENIPPPKDISDQALLDLLDAEDPTGFRIPMSLGEPHAEIDKSGKGCTAYELVVNTEFLDQVGKRNVLMGFFITVVLEGFENKYSISLDRNWKILKNKKFIGSLPEQNIRCKSKPMIMDMENQGELTTGGSARKSLISEISSNTSQTKDDDRPKAPEPPYTILQEPATGYPEFLVAEIHMPKVKSASSLALDFGEDRILLQTRSNVYHLDIYLQYNLVQEDCGAQFNRKTKILTLTMPVQPPS